MRKGALRSLWLLCILFLFLLSCNLITNVSDRVSGIRNTAESVATDVQEGRDLLSTGQAVITQVEGSSLVQTLQAVVTEQGPAIRGTVEALATEQGPAIQETVAAFATQQVPAFLDTAEAFATEQGPGAQQTLQAVATEQGPAVQATAQALATQLAESVGELPPDIPLAETDPDNLVATSSLVTYNAGLTVAEVIQFYETQMPANGWTPDEDELLRTDNAAILAFSKDNRQATITITAIPGTEQTAVVITISGQ